MKTRKERFQKYRSNIQLMDDGDLPISQSKGKHLKKETPHSLKSELSFQSNDEKLVSIKKKDWTRSRIFVYSLITLIFIFAILGIIMAILN